MTGNERNQATLIGMRHTTGATHDDDETSTDEEHRQRTKWTSEKRAVKRRGARRKCGVRMATTRAVLNWIQNT